MKRIVIVGLFACSLLFTAQRPVLGQNESVETPAKQTHSQTPRWQTIGNARVLRVWEVEGPDKYPQIALLWVSTDDLQKFSHDPLDLLKFVNDHKVFSKAVITVGPCVTLSAVDETSDTPGWIITAVHTQHSRMTMSALPANPELRPLK